MQHDEIHDLWTSVLSEAWHRPYGMALMETNPSKRSAWIAEAEKAILARYIELQSSAGLEIQFRDLRRATDELRRLKSATAVEPETRTAPVTPSAGRKAPSVTHSPLSEQS
jgi:hypothetical protein